MKNLSPFLLVAVLLVAGIIIGAPFINFQDYLSQGDHGRDLYAAQAVYRGELPYQDFWWVYGPLMPYYYGLFFKIFGTNISSILLGKLLLKILCGLFIFLGLRHIISQTAALAGACWFMLFAQDFFFTYNHIGGVAMMLGAVFCLLSYIRQPSASSAWGALGFSFLLCLIKINFGLVALAMSILTVKACDFYKKPSSGSKKYFYLTSLMGLPAIVFIIYFLLLKNLSITEIRQCLPYLGGDQPYETSPWIALINFIQMTWRTITSNWMNVAFAVIVNASALRCGYLLLKKKLAAPSKYIFLMTIGFLCLLYIANSHEYLKSGVHYRQFWAQPVSILLSFVLIDTAWKTSPLLRKIIFCILVAIALISWLHTIRSVNALKKETQFVSLPSAKIYTSNAPAWISTVKQTTEFLTQTLKSNELFFTLPYDCLYYYLTDKRTPTRQLIFFDHIKISPAQEESVIAELEKNKINYVVLSNRAFARQEPGLGILGESYCPLIGKYINDNFAPIVRIGDWGHEPGWAWNHGTLILKRKETP